MSTQKRNQIVVRQPRTQAELVACSELEHGYETEYVWQVDVREESDDTAVRFRTVRLPRQMQVHYPRDRATLLRAWESPDCFLVAAVDDIVLGYVNLRPDALHLNGWIHDLVVDRRVRRRRIGSALLDQALRWAHLHDLRYVTLSVQTKNTPAINFARSHGFTFCGFNDHYYANQDIALFFGRAL